MMSWSRARHRREIAAAIAEAETDDEFAELWVRVAGQTAFALELDPEQAIRWEWQIAATDGLVGDA